jgi:hypothetical protein
MESEESIIRTAEEFGAKIERLAEDIYASPNDPWVVRDMQGNFLGEARFYTKLAAAQAYLLWYFHGQK